MENFFLDARSMNSRGLFLDVIGAALIFKFGLPADIRRSGASYLLLESSPDEKEKQLAKKYDLWGRIGIGLLIIGFILQIISNYL